MAEQEKAQPQNNLPPEEADLKERIDGFNKELLPILGKYELGLAALPKILRDGRIAADPVIVSVRKQVQAMQGKPAPEATPEGGLSNPDA